MQSEWYEHQCLLDECAWLSFTGCRKPKRSDIETIVCVKEAIVGERWALAPREYP